MLRSFLPRGGVGAVVLIVATGVASFLVLSQEASAQQRRNFAEQNTHTQTSYFQTRRQQSANSDRGFFNRLFSFRRSRRLSDVEIQNRLAGQTKNKKPKFFVYEPEPLYPLPDANLEGETEATPLAEEILRILKEPQVSKIRTLKRQAKAIRAFYKQRKFAPIWVSDDGLEQKAQDVLAFLSRADEEGLQSHEYLAPSISKIDDESNPGAHKTMALARFDVELTVAYLEFARHASAGRVVPGKIGADFDIKPVPVDPTVALSAAIKRGKPSRFLRSLLPVHEAYLRMKQELARFRAKLGTKDEQTEIPNGGLVKLGGEDDRIPLIRKRLTEVGLLSAATRPARTEPGDVGDAIYNSWVESEHGTHEPAAHLYDETMEIAIKSFQASRNLARDGIIGQRTIAALNKRYLARAERIEKLTLGMERMRWMPREFGSRHIFVNQPSYEARVIENGKMTLSMRVVIGKTRFPTPEFSDKMELVVFNPYWNVPRSIAGNEMLPQLWKDPGYLDRAGYQLLDKRGRQVSSTSVDWSSYSGKSMPYRVRQPPGRGNALGAVKFMFPNKHAVYMHDTPAKNLFSKLTRAYSHGCVRVQKPYKFAQTLLGWSKERVSSTITNGQNREVRLDRTIPVHLSYFTAWPDQNGIMQYYDDIYQRDKALLRALVVSRSFLSN